MIAKPNRKTKSMVKGWDLSKQKGASQLTKRLRASFEYIGPALDTAEAAKVWN